jgi:hypothetical protein
MGCNNENEQKDSGDRGAKSLPFSSLIFDRAEAEKSN